MTALATNVVLHYHGNDETSYLYSATMKTGVTIKADALKLATPTEQTLPVSKYTTPGFQWVSRANDYD